MQVYLLANDVNGKLGGKRAGELRMQNFTPEQRKATARTAAAARWGRVGTR